MAIWFGNPTIERRAREPPRPAGIASRHRIHRIRRRLPARHHAGGAAHAPAHGLPARRRFAGAGRNAGQRGGELRGGPRRASAASDRKSTPITCAPCRTAWSSAPRGRSTWGPQPGLEHRNPRSAGTTGVHLASHRGRGGMAVGSGGQREMKRNMLCMRSRAATLAACGQKGPLYLPDADRRDRDAAHADAACPAQRPRRRIRRRPWTRRKARRRRRPRWWCPNPASGRSGQEEEAGCGRRRADA